MSKLSGGEGIIFIGGAPRSGTTLVQNILDSHSKIYGGPEFDRIPDVMKLRKKFHISIDDRRINTFFTKNDLDRKICSFIEDLLLPTAHSNNCEMLSEKTPSNVLCFSELAEICPRAKFVFVLRDPRAIVASMINVKKRALENGVKPASFIRNIFASISYIEKSIGKGFFALKKYPDRTLLIKYEELVTQPENITKRICSFLNIEWEAGLLIPGEKKHAGEVIADNIWGGNQTFRKNIGEYSKDKWKKELSYIDQYLINKVFASYKEIASEGYGFSLDYIPVRYRILGKFKLLYRNLYTGLLMIMLASRKLRGLGLLIYNKLNQLKEYRNNT